MSLTETPVGQVDAIKSRFKFGNDAKFEIFVGGKKDIVLTENWLKTQGVGATISDIFVAYYDDKIQKLIAIQAVDPTPILNSTLPDLLSQQTPLH